MDLNQYILGIPHHLAARGVQAEKLEAIQKIKQKRMEMNGGGGGREKERERHKDRRSLVWNGRDKWTQRGNYFKTKKEIVSHRWSQLQTWGWTFPPTKDVSSLTTGQRASTTDSADPYTSTHNAGNNVSQLSPCVNHTIYHNALQFWKICRTAADNPDDKEKQGAPSSLSV